MKTEQLKIFGARLKSARMIAGLSLRELSEKIDNEVTKQSLSKYEKGLMLPTPKVLQALSKALNQKVDFFLVNSFIEFKSISYRKKQDLTKKEEEAILEKARAYYESYSEVENILGLSAEFVNPVDKITIDNYEDVEKAANILRKEWNLGIQPISNLIEMLESVGIKVFVIEHSDKIDGVSVEVESGCHLVIINISDKPLERIRFTILHELAHTFLRFSETIKKAPKLLEKMCHYFASCLLLPRTKLLEMIGGKKRTYIKIAELESIKNYFGISIRAIVYRLKQIGIITENYHKRWSIWLNKTYGVKNEPGNYIGVEKSYRFMQLINRALSEELISISKASALTGENISDIKRIEPVG
jgi:Zn-dependent peptidase ImmA (M78 family)/DNA-binding XRE family transcriptional regulator